MHASLTSTRPTALFDGARRRIGLARAAVGFVRLVRDPNELGEVFTVAGSMADRDILQSMADHVSKDGDCARALVAQRRLPPIDLHALKALPEGTLGRAFAEHMLSNGLDPASIPTLPADDDLLFLRAHLFETHDIWHVVTGFATDVAGELGLQAFYCAQLPGKLPIALLAMGFLNTLLYAYDDREARMDAIARGWTLGKTARPLFGARWDELWTAPLADVRERFALEPRRQPLAA